MSSTLTPIAARPESSPREKTYVALSNKCLVTAREAKNCEIHLILSPFLSISFKILRHDFSGSLLNPDARRSRLQFIRLTSKAKWRGISCYHAAVVPQRGLNPRRKVLAIPANEFRFKRMVIRAGINQKAIYLSGNEGEKRERVKVRRGR